MQEVIDAHGHQIGTFDGKKVISTQGREVYSIDSNYIYSVETKRLIGELDSNFALDIWGHLIFTLNRSNP